MALVVAACGQPSPEPQPVADGPLWFSVLGEPGEAILLGMPPDGDAPLQFVVGGAAGEREIAQVANPVAGVEGGWIRTAVANQAGLAPLVVEEPVDQRRLLVYDLNQPSAPVHEVPGDAWHALGPRGLIAIGRPTEHGGGPGEVVVHDLGSSPTRWRSTRCRRMFVWWASPATGPG